MFQVMHVSKQPHAASLLLPCSRLATLATSGAASSQHQPARPLAASSRPTGPAPRSLLITTAATRRCWRSKLTGPLPGVTSPPLAAAAGSLPQWAAERAVEALKEEHAKPTDREVAAAAAVALAATSSSVHHSKTALGYLAREAPLLTWLPLLACAAVGAAGVFWDRARLVWAAVGGLASFLLTVWQVLAPLVRRFQALRSRLIEADKAAKHRLDLAAQQLNKAVCERGEAQREAEQAQEELCRMQQMAQAPSAATAAATPGSYGSWSFDGSAATSSSGGEGPDGVQGGQIEAGSLTGGPQEEDSPAGGPAGRSHRPLLGETEAAEKQAELEHAVAAKQAELERVLEERQKQEQRLASILNNALNAAAVPPMAHGDGGCGINEEGPGACNADLSTDYEMLDGYGERTVDRNNAVELAGALQARVDALRRQALEAAAEHGEVTRLQTELREKTDTVVALQAQLEIAKASARRLPQLQQYLRDVEWQLLKQQQQRQERLRAAGLQAGAAAAAGMDVVGAEAESAEQRHDRSSSTSDGVRRGRGRPRGSGRRKQSEAVGEAAAEAPAAEAPAAEAPAAEAPAAEAPAAEAPAAEAPAAEAPAGGNSAADAGVDSHVAADVAADLAEVHRHVSQAEHHVEEYDKQLESLGHKLEVLQGQQPEQGQPPST